MFLLDVAGLQGYFYNCIVVGQRGEFNTSLGKSFFGYGETIGVAGNHTNYFATVGAESLNGFKATATG